MAFIRRDGHAGRACQRVTLGGLERPCGRSPIEACQAMNGFIRCAAGRRGERRCGRRRCGPRRHCWDSRTAFRTVQDTALLKKVRATIGDAARLSPEVSEWIRSSLVGRFVAPHSGGILLRPITPQQIGGSALRAESGRTGVGCAHRFGHSRCYRLAPIPSGGTKLKKSEKKWRGECRGECGSRCGS